MAVVLRYLAYLLPVLLPLSLAQIGNCPCADKKHCETIKRPPGKEYLMFSTKPDLWKKYDWTKVTTIALFRKWDDELMCVAHSKGVRVVLSAAYPVNKLENSQLRSQWVKNLTEKAMAYHADGVNIDIEEPIKEKSKETSLLTKLASETADAFHEKIPGSQVTFDVAWSPNCIDGRCYDAKGLADAVDFLVVMGYDEMSQMFGPTCQARANSPINQTKQGVTEYIKLKISPEKLVLGVPWYGYDYICNPGISVDDDCYIKRVPFRGANCSDAAGRQIEYSTINDLIIARSEHGRKWCKKYGSPYFNYFDPIGRVHQVWYDDPESLGMKYMFVRDNKLRGVAVWNSDILDYSDLTRAKYQTRAMWDALMHVVG